MKNKTSRIGFVSTRLSGTDGVSLETTKWVKVLSNLGHECFYFAGASEWSQDRSYVVEEAHFNHPEVRRLTEDLFDDYIRSPETSETIEKLKNHLKGHLHQFVKQFELDLLIVENALAIPMNVPLGLAITELGAETEMPIIGHHHDFAWERARFAVGAADDYLRGAFPPTLYSMTHVVINSFARRQLALRAGVSSTIIPNVMDFETPPPEPDGYADDLRTALDIDAGDYFLLQPTRIVPRKRIERAIELARRLDLPCVIVISHASGDEGSAYADYLRDYIDLLGAEVRFAANRFADERGQTEAEQKIYSLADAYQSADFVTYPSTVEGFGNAFLEAIYYRQPIVMSTYEIYRTDIQPKGFQVVEFGDFITEAAVNQTRQLLHDKEKTAEMVDHNYRIARRHYSYVNLEKNLAALISQCLGE